jgi:hypothetical protein
MKKIYYYNFLITQIEYWVIYLIKTFVYWKFTNPFYWLIHIADYTGEDRFIGLTCVVMWQGLQIFTIWSVIDEKKKADIKKPL